MSRRWPVLVPLLLLASCHGAFTVTRTDKGVYLMPPDVDEGAVCFSMPGVATEALTAEVTSPAKFFAIAPKESRHRHGSIEATVHASLVLDASDDAVRADFLAFRVLLENLENKEGAGGLQPRAAERIAARMASAVPAPIGSTLFYHYGLTVLEEEGVGKAAVELQPGMRLRVEHEVWTPAALEDDPQGYVGTGASYLVVADGSNGNRYFDPFVATLRSAKLLNLVDGDHEPPFWVAGVEDLGRASRYWTATWPATLSRSTAHPLDNARQPQLRTAERYCNLVSPAAPDCKPATPNRALFRERAMLVPEITVVVAGTPQWVSLGTTLGGLLAQQGTASVVDARQVRLERRVDGRLVEVEFESHDSSALELPLVKGDVASW